MTAFLKKLRLKRIWKRIFYERLTEPLHLNLLAIFVYVFGSFRAKEEFDLVMRSHNAYAILKCADRAKELGFSTVTLIEFGVASGAGLMNMAAIAEKVTRKIGIAFEIYGFDSGRGMPPAADYRDHPDLYQEGDYKMDIQALDRLLPGNTHLILGDIATTVDGFLMELSADAPIGFVVMDIDYYSSTMDALKIFKAGPEKYLPLTIVFLDDINCEPHNSFCGELLAIDKFNTEEVYRKIEHHRFFENSRIFKHAIWIKHIYQLHVLDHPTRFNTQINRMSSNLDNPYLT